MEIKSWQSWIEAWSGIVVCNNCSAIIDKDRCSYCSYQHITGSATQIVNVNGKEVEVPITTRTGGMDYTTFSFLNLMEREWKRPAYKPTFGNYNGHEIPERLLIVLLFWSLYENLLDKFFTDALVDVKESISKDLLKRYASVGSRMDQLYKMLFSTSFKDDITEIGYGHIYDHIKNVQNKRNQFMHGDANAIDDSLVKDTIEYLQESQKAWIALYNKRCARVPAI